jgi:hypothetical protein
MADPPSSFSLTARQVGPYHLPLVPLCFSREATERTPPCMSFPSHPLDHVQARRYLPRITLKPFAALERWSLPVFTWTAPKHHRERPFTVSAALCFPTDLTDA